VQMMRPAPLAKIGRVLASELARQSPPSAQHLENLTLSQANEDRRSKVES